jgi:hypothetical protein
VLMWVYAPVCGLASPGRCGIKYVLRISTSYRETIFPRQFEAHSLTDETGWSTFLTSVCVSMGVCVSVYVLVWVYAVCCMLYVVCCMLYAVCCMLYVVCCMLYAVCCMLYVVCT